MVVLSVVGEMSWATKMNTSESDDNSCSKSAQESKEIRGVSVGIGVGLQEEWKINLDPSMSNEYVFRKTSCATRRSNYHGRPNNTWQAFIGTTSHHIVSEYKPSIEKWNCTRSVIKTLVVWFSQARLYGWGWGDETKANLLRAYNIFTSTWVNNELTHFAFDSAGGVINAVSLIRGGLQFGRVKYVMKYQKGSNIPLQVSFYCVWY